ncbi:type VII secretion integral membrane protein EccD [Streptomyces sp. HUAS TT20]|uniref:type VII secretion integral membrane protein EccD n=1 Tax=Streptomyces sp. HUAS TT20 TaxID=3447509 RepID=UPI0021DA9545|nr:type VII secretion integral membrane protein EccD [Streptomyces sp. HUAS 15-9]UXY32594.1 type VII secretion integral membrane protein EccD [Streptomyces sp. HUAS 15-9]
MSAGALSHTADSGTAVVLSRVTLVGERRRIDLVLPAREPVGLLLPEILRLLDDRVGERPELRHLLTPDGSALDHGSTLEAAGVRDGAVLRLVRAEDAPSAPVVHDVSDEVAEDLGGRSWRWGPGSRHITAGLATVGWAGAAALFARTAYDPSVVAGALLAVAVVAALAGALLGRARQRRGLVATLLCSAGVLGMMGVSSLADGRGWSAAPHVAALASVGVVTLVLLGWFTALGRGGLVGAAAVGVTVLGWEGVVAVQSGAGMAGQQARVGAVLAVASVVVLGLLPRLALMASGLAGLDDRRAGGVSVSRYQVSAALAAAHRGLVLATVAVTVSAALAVMWALRAPTVWTVPLAVVTAVVMMLRARAFPLIAEVVGLLAGGALVAVRLLWVWVERSGAAGPALVVLAVLAVLPLAVLVVQPAEHVRVRLRRAGDLLESVGVIALLPLLIGVFGVYGRLLGTFA